MSTVTVLIDGSDETDSVVFDTAHFESQVNGVAGACQFRLRDLNLTKSIQVGSTLVLEIDGDVAWQGFVAVVNRVYIFPVVDVTEPGLARFMDITGTDINILLTKRIVFNQADPADVYAPLLPEHTADTTAITELFDDWLDLSGDGIDTTSLVENVGDTTWTQEGRAWEGSDTWSQAMQSIADLPAAIYYIDPDKNFVYTDVDTPNAPFGLSDQYDGVTTFGYREMEVLADGSSLANDVLCWGIGYGSQVPVFVRDEDASSQSEHGVWQLAQTSFGVYKQTTINRIAQSIIDGSPQSKRGAKDDRYAVQCVTYQPGLRVAQKVDFTSTVFGYNDVIPIRKMEIDFESPEYPKYTLTLSHEIDTPFSFFDNLLWPPLPPFECPPPLVMGPNGYCILPPLPPPQEECPRGCLLASCIADDFDRTVAAPDWGSLWVTQASTAAGGGVADEIANVADVTFWNITRSPTVNVTESGFRSLDLGSCPETADAWDYYAAWTADTAFFSYEVYNDAGGFTPPGTYIFPGLQHTIDGEILTVPFQFLEFWFESDNYSEEGASNPTLLRIAMDSTSGAYWALGNIGFSTSFVTPTPFTFTFGATYKVHLQLSDDGTTRANLWDASGDEPAGWMIERTATNGTPEENRPYSFNAAFVRGIQLGPLSTTHPENNSFIIDPVKIDLVCGDFASPPCGPLDGTYAIFDDFNRSVSPNGWGNSSGGYGGWTRGSTQGSSSVNGSHGLISASATRVGLSAAVATEGEFNDHFWFLTVPFVISFDISDVVDTGISALTGDLAWGPIALQDGVASPNQLWLDFAPYIKGSATSHLPASRLSTNATNTNVQYGDALTSGKVYIFGEADGVTILDSGGNIVIDKEPWRNSSGGAMDVSSRVPGFLSFACQVIAASVTTRSLSYEIDNISFKDESGNFGTFCSANCWPNGPLPTAGVPLAGLVCEEKITGGQVIYLAHSFLPKSSLVWLNGILQLQSALTEDPVAGTITLDFDPPNNTAVRVCYWSLP